MTVYINETLSYPKVIDFKMKEKDAQFVITKNGFYVVCGENLIVDASTIFAHGDAWIEMFALDGFKKYIHIDEKESNVSSFGIRIE